MKSKFFILKKTARHYVFFFWGLLLSFDVCAAEIVASGTPSTNNGCGSNCSWTLYDDGKFIVTGNGAMDNYGQKNGTVTAWTVDGSPWDDYITQIKSVSIASGITAIGGDAFAGATALTKVDIPDTVVSIRGGAFQESSISNIELPSSISAIGAWAFASVPLQSITIPGSVKRIEEGTFWGTQFDTLVVPDSVEYIGKNAFYHADLTNIVISESLENIDPQALSSASKLQNIYCVGKVDVCKANVGETLSGKVQAATAKKINGMTYIFDSKGRLVSSAGNRMEKRIYTIEEASAVAGKKNTVKIRYK